MSQEWSQFYLLYNKLTENCYCNIANCESIPCLHLGFLLITVTPNWQEKITGSLPAYHNGNQPHTKWPQYTPRPPDDWPDALDHFVKGLVAYRYTKSGKTSENLLLSQGLSYKKNLTVLLQATFWFLFGIFVHCEMQQSWAKKTLKNFHRIYSIHFYIQQQLSVIFFYHDNLTKSIYYSLAHFRSAHLMIPWKSCGGLFLLSVI